MKKIQHALSIIVAGVLLWVAPLSQGAHHLKDEGFKSIFDGATLEGWEGKEGTTEALVADHVVPVASLADPVGHGLILSRTHSRHFCQRTSGVQVPRRSQYGSPSFR